MIFGRRYVVATAHTDTSSPNDTDTSSAHTHAGTTCEASVTSDGVMTRSTCTHTPSSDTAAAVISKLALTRRAPITTVVITAPCERLCELMEGNIADIPY